MTRVERLVLTEVLSTHPVILCAHEISTLLNTVSVPQVRDALDSLASVGLIREDGDSVFPTQAAIYFDQLRIDAPA